MCKIIFIAWLKEFTCEKKYVSSLVFVDLFKISTEISLNLFCTGLFYCMWMLIKGHARPICTQMW